MRIKPKLPLKKIVAVMLGIYVLRVGRVNTQQTAIFDYGVHS